MSKATIIGAGSVGATIAYTMALNAIVSEIVIIDINEKKAFGEAMDISQGAPFSSPVTVYSGGYEDAVGSDIVVITSGLPRKAGQSRLELAQTNVNVIKEIAPQIVKHAPEAVYILVSNPVDVLTYVFHKISGIPEERIIGSGTILDTSRVRSFIADKFDINQKTVHAYVFGEHGDSSFVPWSLATVGTIPLEQYRASLSSNLKNEIAEIDYEEAEKYTRTSGGTIIANKGATFYGVSVSVCHICKCLLGSKDTLLTVSTMMHGEMGVDDVCMSALALVGPGGIKGTLVPPLTDEEKAKFVNSANKLKEVINSVTI